MYNLSAKFRWKIVLAAGALLFLSGPAPAEEPLPTTRNLEELVSKWVELKKNISTEKTDWQKDQARIEVEYDLLQKEKLILEEEISAARSNNSARAEERAGLILKKEALTRALDETGPDLTVAEEGLKQWREIIPPSLSTPLEPLFTRLERSSELPVSQRLQIIFSLYGEIETLQHDIRTTKEILTTESGREREFDLIYLGLARGFCVSEDNSEAGIGHPTENGWAWEWNNGLSGSIRRALEYYNREKSAGLVALPLEITEDLELN